MPDYREFTIRHASDSIRRQYGIELKWTEKSALFQYCEGQQIADGISHFMNDYFGIDHVMLGKRDIHRWYWKANDISREHIGMDLLGTEEFKEYCRSYVDMWRQERELL